MTPKNARLAHLLLLAATVFMLICLVVAVTQMTAAIKDNTRRMEYQGQRIQEILSEKP